jgi:ribose/xylose/arabinose/galactoside ABC-type transport system permease subunit
VLAPLVITANLLSPAFLGIRNFTGLFKQAVPLGILTVGQTAVILTGGIERSLNDRESRLERLKTELSQA